MQFIGDVRYVVTLRCIGRGCCERYQGRRAALHQVPAAAVRRALVNSGCGSAELCLLHVAMVIVVLHTCITTKAIQVQLCIPVYLFTG
jgi:hypothetical protein